MGNDIAAHRAAIGLFYCNTNGISLKTVFLSSIFKYVHAMSLINVDIIVITLLDIHLLLLSGDIEFNPGPGGTPDLIESVLPICHGNIKV